MHPIVFSIRIASESQGYLPCCPTPWQRKQHSLDPRTKWNCGYLWLTPCASSSATHSAGPCPSQRSPDLTTPANTSLAHHALQNQVHWDTNVASAPQTHGRIQSYPVVMLGCKKRCEASNFKWKMGMSAGTLDTSLIPHKSWKPRPWRPKQQGFHYLSNSFHGFKSCEVHPRPRFTNFDSCPILSQLNSQGI